MNSNIQETVASLINGAKTAADSGELSYQLHSIVAKQSLHDLEDANEYMRIREIDDYQEAEMDDKDTKRLEDRIEAVNREGQLRLDAAMARIDGKFDTMMASMQHMDQSVSQTAERISGMKSIIIGTAIATVIAIVGAVFAGQALWASGFSSGQTDRPAVTSGSNASTH